MPECIELHKQHVVHSLKSLGDFLLLLEQPRLNRDQHRLHDFNCRHGKEQPGRTEKVLCILIDGPVKHTFTLLVSAESDEIHQTQIPRASEISGRVINLKSNINPLFGYSTFELLFGLQIFPNLEQQFFVLGIILVIFLSPHLQYSFLRIFEGLKLIQSLPDTEFAPLIGDIFYLAQLLERLLVEFLVEGMSQQEPSQHFGVTQRVFYGSEKDKLLETLSISVSPVQQCLTLFVGDLITFKQTPVSQNQFILSTSCQEKISFQVMLLQQIGFKNSESNSIAICNSNLICFIFVFLQQKYYLFMTFHYFLLLPISIVLSLLKQKLSLKQLNQKVFIQNRSLSDQYLRLTLFQVQCKKYKFLEKLCLKKTQLDILDKQLDKKSSQDTKYPHQLYFQIPDFYLFYNLFSYFKITFSLSLFTFELGTLSYFAFKNETSLKIESLPIDIPEKLEASDSDFFDFTSSEFILLSFCYFQFFQLMFSKELFDLFKASATSLTGRLNAAKYSFLVQSCFSCILFMFYKSLTSSSLSSLSSSLRQFINLSIQSLFLFCSQQIEVSFYFQYFSYFYLAF